MIFNCSHCGINFERSARNAYHNTNKSARQTKNIFCSRQCSSGFNNTRVLVSCANCNKEFLKARCEFKSANNFCSRSCNVTYQNLHKQHGTRVSKLEKYLQAELMQLYTYEFHFNRKDAINSELDIYIPELKLAFELNGIFHYEPIYGQEKLDQIQNNDDRKFQACIERGIELCIIDSSKYKYFKPATAKKFLDIITSVINKKAAS